MGMLSKNALRAALGGVCFAFVGLMVSCSGSGPDGSTDESVSTQSEALTAATWQANKSYAVNAIVSYQGKLYRCLQAHTSAVGWEPPNVPALWSFEGLDTGSNTNTGPTGPTGAITLDYVTLQADCDSFPQTCCAAGAAQVKLGDAADVRSFTGTTDCIMSAAGNDTITVSSTSSRSSLNLGSGNDTAMDGPGDNFIWAGVGDDTINGYGGTNLFFGGWGNDTINAANGSNTVIPGPGRDTVALGTGNDTVYLFDLCEVESGKRLDGGTGTDTLYTPVPLADLRARGMTVDNFENVIVVDNRCRSQCSNHTGCSYCADDDDKDGTLNCQDSCPLDPAKISPGLCNCGVSEVDSDTDGVPDCIDECKLDAQSSYNGQCQCPSSPAANGKACNDGITPGTFTCNAGVCGNPNSSAPQSGCTFKTYGAHYYWFCPAATEATATQRCGAVTGRKLLQIDTRQENAFTAKFVSGESWIGAVDRTTEGEFSWLNGAGQETKKFWTGGGSGKPFKSLYQSWIGGNPGSDGAKDCATLSSDRGWRVQNCADSRPYVCEGVFGWARTPGPGPSGTHTPVGPAGIYPGWSASTNGHGPGNDDGNGASNVLPTDCTNPVSQTDLDKQTAELDACAERCSPTSTNKADEATCDTLCSGAAKRPPAGSRCSNNGQPLTELVMDDGGIGKCSVDNQNCSAVTYMGSPTHCGMRTVCADVYQNTDGVFVTQLCKDGCRNGMKCDKRGFCINPDLHSACDATTTIGTKCVGQCYTEVGCGIDSFALEENDGSELCSETRVCAPEYTAQLNAGSTLDGTKFDDTPLTDLTASTAPDYSGDFVNQPCTGNCVDCSGAQANDPECIRAARHQWCNYEQSTVGPRDAKLNDDKVGDRGDDSSVIKFKVDPGADLNFDLTPLPFGIPNFKVNAAAAVRAEAAFNLGVIRGTVELIDLRGELEASLCKAATDSSHVEILGLDFLPTLLSAVGAESVIFNTDKTWSKAQQCKDAVKTYVDTVDRAKKALRDAQELVKQFNDLKNGGHTFSKAFCTTYAGPGMRPQGMTGSCDTETPAETVNAFIKFYEGKAKGIGPALSTLAQNVLSSSELGKLLNQAASTGFAFYQPIGKPDEGLGGKEATTILTLNFMIGPVPCNLEVSSFLNYGIKGGFGANLEPAALISGGGAFAKAGAVITPFADAGVTLFVGVGFDAGPFSLKLGIEGAVNLGNIELPATAAAGLSMVPEGDTRTLPEEFKGLTSGETIYPPPNLGRLKYGFQFDYSYGVDFTVSHMLDGHIDAALKIKFLFFSKKWAKRIVSFDSGLSIGPMNLLGGGSYHPDTKKHDDPVQNDVKSWKSTYDSVPFVKLNTVEMPKDTTLTADGEFVKGRATKLFYDSLCTCKADGGDCFRRDDCCSPTASCFSDPAQAGKSICRQCGQPDYATTCNSSADCCDGNPCTDELVPTNCVTDPCPKPTGGGFAGQPNICVPVTTCTWVKPATKVCRPKPIEIPDPDVE